LPAVNVTTNGRARRDDETQRQQLRRSATLAALAFIGLIAIDYVIVLTLHPEVDILWCAAWRAVGALVTFAGRPIFARRGRSGRTQTLIASILVLAGAIAAGHRARVYDAVILKTLGATRPMLIGTYTAEY
ncbi:MAG TPA: hypothetical protein PK095_22105, partial [Myxococcota bacterium]|nr:hypothetical protein [Myxococcota bacterium]